LAGIVFKMRLLILLGVLGFASSILMYEIGHEYVYKYNGKILTGVPDIDTHFAGLHILCDVIVQVVDATTFKMMLKNVQFAKFDERLTGPEPMNWRTVVTPAPATVVDPTMVQLLESPVVFTMVQGKITTLKISQLEAEWSVNIKKALVGLMKIQEPAAVLDLHGNLIDQSGSLPALPNFYQVMEEGVDGTCMNTYTITELPAYTVKDPANGYADLMKPELCTGMKIFQITKARDFTKCEKLNMLHVSHTMGQETLPRTSTATHLGCGHTTANIVFHGAVHEGEMVHKMLSFTNEPMITGTMQTLKLFAVKTVLSTVPAIVQPRTVTNILYEWPVMSGSFSEHMLAPFITKGTPTPLATIRTPDMMTKVPELATNNILTDIFTKLTEMTTELNEVDHLQKKQLTSKLMSIAHVFSMLTVDDMKLLVDKINSAALDTAVKKVMMDLTLDVATMTGTTHAVLFVKHIIETEQATPLKTLNIITTLGHHIRTPTVEMLNHIFAIVKSPVILKNKVLKHNALLNFANLLNKVCIVTTKTAKFPVHVFGVFCTEMTPEITTTYIPYMINELKTTTDVEYRDTLIISLGTIGHEAVLPILFPYIQGKVAGDTTHVRLLTIMSLSHVVEKHSTVLIPAYMSLLNNPVEDHAVRTAALLVILKTKVTMAQMQRLAILTWHEKDPEMVKFLYSALKSLSMIEPAKLIGNKHLLHIVHMAKAVFPLAKPIPGMLFSSSNVIIAEWLKELNRGYESLDQVHLHNRGNHFMSKINIICNKVKVPFLKLFFGLKGEKTVIDQLMQTFTEALNGEVVSNSPLDSVHSEWRTIVQDMRIQSRTDVPFKSTLYFKAFDDILTMFGIGQTTLDEMKSKIKATLANPTLLTNAICGKTPFHITKAFNIMPTEVIVVTEMGLPIVVEAHQPHLLSLQGHVNINCGAASIELNMKNKWMTNAYGHVTTICPFTKELIMAGVDKHISVNKPIKTVLKIEPATGKVVMNVVPVVTPTTKAVDFVHYHVKPFTCIRTILDFTPLTLHPGMKVIHTMPTPNMITTKIGEHLGIDTTMTITHEAELFDLKMLYDRWHLYNFNLFNNMLFHWTRGVSTVNGMPSNKFVEFTLTYNPMTSTTKEFQMDMKVGLASMIQNEQALQHMVRSSGIHSSPVSSSKLETMLSKMEMKKNWAFTMLSNILLKGTATKTFTFSMTAGWGGDHINQKWSVHVDQLATNLGTINICMDGAITLPVVPVWSVEALWANLAKFKFQNKLGFGTTCNQYTVDIAGHTAVTEFQKSISKSSKEAMFCQSGQISQSGLTRHAACHAQRNQAATLDEAMFTVTTTGLPTTIMTYLNQVPNFFKVLLWQYTSTCPMETLENAAQLAKVKLHFNTQMHTMTITAVTAEETLMWKHIRLPTMLHGFVPLVAGLPTIEQIHKTAFGTPLRPTCHVSESQIQTYDNYIYNYQLDDCYHIVSSDCSGSFDHAVMAKVVSGLKHVRVFHRTSLIEITPSATYSFSNKDYVITVDGMAVTLAHGEMKTVHSGDGLHVFMITRSVDDVITLWTPHMMVLYNGVRLEAQSRLLKPTGQLCGLCGDSNLDSRADLRTPSFCVFQSNILAAMSYRHQSGQCSALSQSKMDLMTAEEASCVQYKSQQQSMSMAQPQMSLGSVMKHSTIEKNGKMCISQVPVSSCMSGMVAESHIQKMINFTCLSTSNKVTKLYMDKVKRGDILPELSTMDVHHTLQIQMPVYCSQSS